jgi:hypothetical protein
MAAVLPLAAEILLPEVTGRNSVQVLAWLELLLAVLLLVLVIVLLVHLLLFLHLLLTHLVLPFSFLPFFVF